MFNPDEIIFSLTNRCNLNCTHCTVARNDETLDYSAAATFLKNTRAFIDKVGFTGGEPFLVIDKLCQLVSDAVSFDYMFDAISTNGVFNDTYKKLRALYDAKFDGTIRVSVDSYHKDSYGAQYNERIIEFIDNAQQIFKNTIHIEIQSVKSRDNFNIPNNFNNPSKPHDFNNFNKSSEPGDSIKNLINTLLSRGYQVYNSELSPGNNGTWFSDEDCTNMGNIFFVHPNALIAPCCGFNNDDPALIIGKITDTYEQLIKNSRHNKMIDICFNKGLTSKKFGNPISDPCVYCKKLSK